MPLAKTRGPLWRERAIEYIDTYTTLTTLKATANDLSWGDQDIIDYPHIVYLFDYDEVTDSVEIEVKR